MAAALVSGGFFLAHVIERPAAMSPALLPPRLTSLSTCLVTHVPDTWALAWATSDGARHTAARRLGLDLLEVDAIVAWATGAFDESALGWPDVILDLETARAARRRFFPGRGDIVLLELALPEDLVAGFVAAATPTGADEGTPGILLALGAARPPAAGGTLRGFEVLGWDQGAFHSSLCNGLEADFARVLGLRPNGFALLDREEDARAAAAHAAAPSTGAEPGLWLPWAVLEHDASAPG